MRRVEVRDLRATTVLLHTAANRSFIAMANLLSLSAGQIFAKDFRVQKLLAEGGMGAVYVVEQISTGKQRALKLMHPRFVADPRSRARFVQEARVAARIESDHVVEVVSAGVDDASDMPWLAMELLRGETLAEAMERRGSLPPSEIHEIFRQFGHALTAAHDVGLVHRDLKPENLFLATPRRPDVAFMVKILDFGIAKFVGEASVTNSATASVGSPLWMAPEQAGAGGVSPATDVWPLGLLAFYLLTGRYYWVAANVEGVPLAGLLAEILVDPLRSSSERAARWGCPTALPTGFDAWFARCVVRDGAQRYTDARAAIAPLLALLSNWHDATAATMVPASRMPADALVTPGRVVSAGNWLPASGTPPPGAARDSNQPSTRASFPSSQGITPTQAVHMLAPPGAPVYASGPMQGAAPVARRANPAVVAIAVALVAGIVGGAIMVTRLLMRSDDDVPREGARLIDRATYAPSAAIVAPIAEPIALAPVAANAAAPAPQRMARNAIRSAPSVAAAHTADPPRATQQVLAPPPIAPPPVTSQPRVAAAGGSAGNVASPTDPVQIHAPPNTAAPAPAAPPPVSNGAQAANPARASNVAMGPIVVDPALRNEVLQAIRRYGQECWTSAQQTTPGHPSETIRLYVSMGLIGRAYNVHFDGAHDQRLGWCIGAALQRHQFTVSPLQFDISMQLVLTPD